MRTNTMLMCHRSGAHGAPYNGATFLNLMALASALPHKSTVLVSANSGFDLFIARYRQQPCDFCMVALPKLDPMSTICKTLGALKDSKGLFLLEFFLIQTVLPVSGYRAPLKIVIFS